MEKVNTKSLDDLMGLAMEATDLILGGLPSELTEADIDKIFDAIVEVLDELYPNAEYSYN